jgi:hypothetical protein
VPELSDNDRRYLSRGGELSYFIQHVDEQDNPLPCHGSGRAWWQTKNNRKLCRGCWQSSVTLQGRLSREIQAHELVPEHSGIYGKPPRFITVNLPENDGK